MLVPKPFCVLIIAAVLLPCPRLLAQDDAAPHITPRKPVGDVETTDTVAADFRSKPLRVDVNLVMVPVTVNDSLGHPVTSLSKDDFELYEGEAPQRIEYFSGEDAPISVGLVLDYSGSMRNKIEYESEAVSQFFLNANPGDDYFVVTVSSKPTLLATSAQSIGTIEERLASAKPQGGTALFDGVYMGLSKLRSATYPRRALVMVSDGGDNRSRYTLKEIRSMVAEGDVLTYAIGLFDDGVFSPFKTFEERLGRRWLGQVTDLSGGRTIAADTRRDIPLIAAQISRELRNQYVLGYRPTSPEHDGKWRKISVRLKPSAKTQQHLALHFREGYFAPRQ